MPDQTMPQGPERFLQKTESVKIAEPESIKRKRESHEDYMQALKTGLSGLSQKTQTTPTTGVTGGLDLSFPKKAGGPGIQTGQPSAGAVPKTKEEKDSLFSNVVELVDKINIPLYALVGATEYYTKSGNEGRSLTENIKHNIDQRGDWGKYLNERGHTGWATGVAGFAMDMVLDPLNLIGVGLVAKAAKTTKASKIFSKMGMEGLAAAAERSVAKQELRALKKFNIGKIAKIEDEAKMAQKMSKASKRLDKVLGSGEIKDFEKLRDTLLDGMTKRQALLNSTPGLVGYQLAKAAKASKRVDKFLDTTRYWFKYDPRTLEKMVSTTPEQLRSLAELKYKHNTVFKTLTDYTSAKAREAAQAGMKYTAKEDSTAQVLFKAAADMDKKLEQMTRDLRGIEAPHRYVQAIEDWARGIWSPKDKIVSHNGMKWRVSKNDKIWEPLTSGTRMIPKTKAEIKNILKEGDVKWLPKYKEAEVASFKPLQWTRKKVVDPFLDTERVFGKSIDDIMREFDIPKEEAQKRYGLAFVNTLGKAYGDILRTFKASKTVFNPGTHVNNLLGNTVITMQAGINPTHPEFLAALAHARKIIKDTDHPLYVLFDSFFDIHGGSQTLSREIFRHEEGVEAIVREIKKKELPGVLGKASRFGDTVKQVYANEDTMFKIAYVLYHDKRYLGGQLSRATAQEKLTKQALPLIARIADDASELYLNYAKMPQFVQLMRTAPFGAPFLSFSYGYAHTMAKVLAERPSRFSIPMKVEKSLEAAAPPTEKEKEVIAEKLPWLAQPDYGRIPGFFSTDLFGRDEDAPGRYFNYRSKLPFYGYGKFSGEGFEMPFLQNPIYTTSRDLLKNQDVFDRPLYDEFAPKSEQRMDQAQHIYQQLVPSLFPGGYHWEKIGEEAKSPYGDVPGKIMSALGFSTTKIRN